MKILTTSLAAALLGLAAVLAASAVANSADQGRAKERVANRVAVSKPHRAKHKKKKKKAAPPKAVPAPAPEPVTGQLLWGGNFDGSFKPWFDVQSLSSRAAISTAHPFAGSGAGRFEVQEGDIEPQTGDQRSEVSGRDFNAGEDIYVRDEIRIPDGYTFQGPWQLIDQLHEEEWGGSPGIATFLDPSRRISFGAGDSSPIYWRGPALEAERWYTLVYRVNLSRDPSQGFVEVWFDGAQELLLNGATRMYGETIQTGQTYIKAGIYRSQSSTGTSIVEHDSIAIGTTYSVVMAFQ